MEQFIPQRLTSEQMAKNLAFFVNGSHNDEELAKALSREHRYLQGEVFLMMMKIIKGMSEQFDSNNFDGRNEFACRMSKVLTEFYDSEEFYSKCKKIYKGEFGNG